jgi:carbon storage regulator
MLVLTRKPRQELQFGDGRITVTVLEIRGSRVRLGIEAPEHVPIRRAEVLEVGCRSVARPEESFGVR